MLVFLLMAIVCVPCAAPGEPRFDLIGQIVYLDAAVFICPRRKLTLALEEVNLADFGPIGDRLAIRFVGRFKSLSGQDPLLSDGTALDEVS